MKTPAFAFPLSVVVLSMVLLTGCSPSSSPTAEQAVRDDTGFYAAVAKHESTWFATSVDPEDLQSMWSDLAAAAPDDISVSTNDVKTAWDNIDPTATNDQAKMLLLTLSESDSMKAVVKFVDRNSDSSIAAPAASHSSATSGPSASPAANSPSAFDAAGTANVVTDDGYTYSIDYSIRLTESQSDIKSAKPGFANVHVGPATARILLSNTTPGRDLNINDPLPLDSPDPNRQFAV